MSSVEDLGDKHLSMIHSDSSTSSDGYREESCSDQRIYHPVESTQFVGSFLAYSRPASLLLIRCEKLFPAVSAVTPGTGEQAEQKKTWINCLETIHAHTHTCAHM